MSPSRHASLAVRLSLLASSVALASCGQRGPLYLPAPETPAPATAATPVTAPASTAGPAPQTTQDAASARRKQP
ncbi:lipoprotein [Comamonas sp. NLF-1-9]|uniref:LPS translocon maturation chaperone LptM n=1 Tax=Comamonas sp. NLF-1-9 TaxID=2853163 RepID=UPI001C46AD11|nr:lipoprotein [Comamonas sp. NLF-1-9]QXL83112.1 lipoprotein [Comamonas sp. NLF-1-9]